jgi:hypothetical protein
MKSKYIVTNFAYGTGPYLRTTELAIEVNNLFEKNGHERSRIVVPLVYGEKQKKIMGEEFGNFYKKHPNEIILDEKFGDYLRGIFYENETYEQYLSRWVSSVETIGKKIKSHLRKTYNDEIILEIHRSPRISYNIAPAYFVSFAFISEIYKNVLREGMGKIKINRDLVREGLEKVNKIEKCFKINFITFPGTFSYDRNRETKSEVLVPPTVFKFRRDTSFIKRGVYVTITGIPGLDRLYADAEKLGFRVYSNYSNAAQRSIRKLPRVITNKNIIFQFARSGWSSVWLSMLHGKPIVVPEFDIYDDPEIYFNNICVEKLGLGIVYKGEPLMNIIERLGSIKEGMALNKKGIYDKFGTLDGTRYVAKRITDDFLKQV